VTVKFAVYKFSGVMHAQWRSFTVVGGVGGVGGRGQSPRSDKNEDFEHKIIVGCGQYISNY
jgi:hypothetical protein